MPLPSWIFSTLAWIAKQKQLCVAHSKRTARLPCTVTTMTSMPKFFQFARQRAIATSNRFDDPSYVSVTVDAQAKAAAVEKMRKEYEEERRQDALNAPRLKAEKAEEDDVGSTYYVCLDRHARLLSVNSNEPAEVIAQASFASCAEESRRFLTSISDTKSPSALRQWRQWTRSSNSICYSKSSKPAPYVPLHQRHRHRSRLLQSDRAASIRAERIA